MFSIGAFAIIFNEKGQVLLSHRRDIDVWNLPGGGVEPRELPNEAVIREVKEETSLDVVIERLVGVYGKTDKDEIVLFFDIRLPLRPNLSLDGYNVSCATIARNSRFWFRYSDDAWH